MPPSRKAAATDSPIARLRSARNIAPDAFPFDRETLHYIARGSVYGFDCPTLPAIPTGPEARAIWEAAGVSADVIRGVLDLEGPFFASWQEGASIPTDTTMRQEIGTIGVRRLFGLLTAYVEEQGG